MDKLLTLKDVAARLALSQRKVAKDIASRKFGPEPVRLGRSVRYRESDLAAWIRWGCPPTDRFEQLLTQAESTAPKTD